MEGDAAKGDHPEAPTVSNTLPTAGVLSPGELVLNAEPLFSRLGSTREILSALAAWMIEHRAGTVPRRGLLQLARSNELALDEDALLASGVISGESHLAFVRPEFRSYFAGDWLAATLEREPAHAKEWLSARFFPFESSQRAALAEEGHWKVQIEDLNCHDLDPVWCAIALASPRAAESAVSWLLDRDDVLHRGLALVMSALGAASDAAIGATWPKVDEWMAHCVGQFGWDVLATLIHRAGFRDIWRYFRRGSILTGAETLVSSSACWRSLIEGFVRAPSPLVAWQLARLQLLPALDDRSLLALSGSFPLDVLQLLIQTRGTDWYTTFANGERPSRPWPQPKGAKEPEEGVGTPIAPEPANVRWKMFTGVEVSGVFDDIDSIDAIAPPHSIEELILAAGSTSTSEEAREWALRSLRSTLRSSVVQGASRLLRIAQSPGGSSQEGVESVLGPTLRMLEHLELPEVAADLEALVAIPAIGSKYYVRGAYFGASPDQLHLKAVREKAALLLARWGLVDSLPALVGAFEDGRVSQLAAASALRRLGLSERTHAAFLAVARTAAAEVGSFPEDAVKTLDALGVWARVLSRPVSSPTSGRKEDPQPP